MKIRSEYLWEGNSYPEDDELSEDFLQGYVRRLLNDIPDYLVRITIEYEDSSGVTYIIER